MRGGKYGSTIATPRPLLCLTNLAELAERRSASVAVSDRERSLTFAELFSWAGGLAAEVTGRDPGGVAPVPVLVDRSVGAAAGVLGVMLAGRAIAPIDTSDPPLRIAQTVARLGATLIVDATANGAVPSIDLPTATVRKVRPEVRQPAAVDPASTATVVFTSGSTGTPKGVVHDNAALDAQFSYRLGMVTTAGFPKEALLASIGFTAGLHKVLHNMSAGTELVITDASAMSPRALADWVGRHRIAGFNITPSLARSWMQQLQPGRRLEHLRLVTAFGERFDWSDVELIRRVIPVDATIDTIYGATEASQSGVRFVIEPDTPPGHGPVPLGRPHFAQTVRLRPVADEPGAPTEILFCGPLVATGYWGDPAYTATRFGADDDGTRWWRSGDLAVLDERDGYLYRGRVDDLVKIRGKLVEPAETEQALLSVPWVQHAVVLPQQLPAGAVRLVAHVQPIEGATAGASELRTELRRHLPAQLVPSVFVRHAELPLTPRHKADRQVLSSMPVVPWRAGAMRPAAGEVEQVVTGIVARVLAVGEISPDDDLWDLGCDSLAAVEIVGALADAGFGAVELAALIDAPTPAAIAARIERPAATGSAPVTTLNPGGTRSPWWIVAGAGGSALAFLALAAELGADQPVMVLEANAIHRRGRVDLRVEAAARRHLATIRSLQPVGPYRVAGHSAGGLTAFEIGRLLHDAGEEVDVILLDTRAGAAREQHAIRQALLPRIREAARVRIGIAATLAGWRSRDVGVRYGRAFEVGTRLARRYRPTVADIPLTVVQQRGGAAASWRPFAPSVTAHEVGGDHNSMLQPPHVAEVAAVFASSVSPLRVRPR